MAKLAKASAMYAERRGLESHAGKFPDFFCRVICRARVHLCCLSLIVTLWVGILFLPSYIWYSVDIVLSNRSPVCLYVLEQDAWPHFLLYEESPKWRTELTLIAIMLFVCTCRDLKMSSSYKKIQVSLLYNRYPCIAKKTLFCCIDLFPSHIFPHWD